MLTVKSATDFFLWDYDATLFPLTLNRLMVERYSVEIQEFLRDQVFTEIGSFQTQHRVFASKRGWFLRRTLKLDPVAEYFLYEIVYRNRGLFGSPDRKDREVYGFRIKGGLPTSTLRAYASFKAAVATTRSNFESYAYFDIATYFNNIYHHDLVRWFEDVGASADDVRSLGKFLREIVGGRSVDCLPQGLYPAKMIGSSFLSFLEASNRIRASQTVRLMDDMWLFDNDPRILMSDFLLIQKLLSDRGLSINDKKSAILEGREADSEMPTDLDDMKVRLLRRRREELSDAEYGDDRDGEEDPSELEELSEYEQHYLVSLLDGPTIEEEDAELVLTLMRSHSADVLGFLPKLARDFPALAKRVYNFCKEVDDPEATSDILGEVLRENSAEMTEYQLFWFAKLTEDQLLDTSGAGELLRLLYEHGNATSISRAKILEIPDKRFGLPDLREEQLRTGHSDWLAWAAAVGSRVHPKGQRNQLLKYFRRSSPMNRLIGEFVESKC